MSTTTTFDLDRFTRAAEERDAIDPAVDVRASTRRSRSSTRSPSPGAPRVLRTREDDRGVAAGHVRARHDPHGPAHRSRTTTGAAYTQACRYPDGTNVLCATVIELDGGPDLRPDGRPGLG